VIILITDPTHLN